MSSYHQMAPYALSAFAAGHMPQQFHQIPNLDVLERTHGVLLLTLSSARPATSRSNFSTESSHVYGWEGRLETPEPRARLPSWATSLNCRAAMSRSRSCPKFRAGPDIRSRTGS